MKPLPSNPITAWQIEREKIILRIFLRRIQPALARGEYISRAFRRASRYYHGRAFKSAPKRQLRLAPGTLRALWDKWRRGENPAALKLKYGSRPPYIQRSLLLRFIGHCTEHRWPTLKDAWQGFTAGKQNARQARGITYGMLAYSFPASVFYQFQTELKKIESSRERLAALKFDAIVKIANQLPPRPPRRRTDRANLYEI